MSVALRLYEQLTEACEDKTRAKVIADAFEQLEERYPHLKEVATQGHLRERELRLPHEIREAESSLQREIGKVRLDIKAFELKLAETKAELVRWVDAVGLLQTTLVIGVLLKIAHLI